MQRRCTLLGVFPCRMKINMLPLLHRMNRACALHDGGHGVCVQGPRPQRGQALLGLSAFEFLSTCSCGAYRSCRGAVAPPFKPKHLSRQAQQQEPAMYQQGRSAGCCLFSGSHRRRLAAHKQGPCTHKPQSAQMQTARGPSGECLHMVASNQKCVCKRLGVSLWLLSDKL